MPKTDGLTDKQEEGEAEARGVGRPTSYCSEYAEQAYKLCLLGATDEEMADFFGVVVQTIYNWRAAQPEFLESIARGKASADANVAERLYQRALGYSHGAVKIFMPAGAEKPVYADYTEHYPPDTQAASLWLRNRQPAKWRDKQEVEHGAGESLKALYEAVSGRTRGLPSQGD